jgi:hypothetical protein
LAGAARTTGIIGTIGGKMQPHPASGEFGAARAREPAYAVKRSHDGEAKAAFE